MSTDVLSRPHAQRLASAQSVYRGPALWLYDTVVHGLSNPLAWRCPTHRLLDWYRGHLSANHLEAGVGTGFFPDHCAFPTSRPQLALLDLSPHCLRHAANRLARYSPEICRANLLQPLELDGPGFDSAALMYVMHCLPGAPAEKAAVFHHIAAVLNPGGSLVGATILGRSHRHSLAARRLLDVYNHRGIFNNAEDDRDWLDHALASAFRSHELHVVGSVALFAAHA